MAPRINGRTKLAGVIGWPLDHTLSPAMHNAAYDHMGLDAVYVPLPVPNEAALVRVVSAIRVLPFLGFNVTMPFKQAMLGLCDEVAAQARLAGAVNTVHCSDGRLIGYNTDGRGLLESVAEETGFSAEGKRIALLGAGGAAGAALVAMVVTRAARVAVVNRTKERAEELLARVADHARTTELVTVATDEAQDEVSSADLVVNATPVGMNGSMEMVVPAGWLRPGQVVADMVYRPAVTPLLRAAVDAGAKAVGGLGMLVAQGAMSVDIWADADGARAPRDVMRVAAEEGLGVQREGAGK
ncbi:MAG TPA: shikimate dehydrogenase [Coriobacteriia bacterium]